MGALSNAASLAKDPAFRDRVTAAVVGMARAAIAGNADVYRVNYAKAIVTNPVQYVDAFAWIIAADPEIHSLGGASADVSDDVLVGRVQVTWSFMSSPPR